MKGPRANWLADEKNPLSTRVIVNRIWQGHFGRGIVGTPNDFGVMGERPTNQPLLDWLHGVFLDYGWFQASGSILASLGLGFLSAVVVPLVAMLALLPLMIITSLVSYFVNEAISKAKYAESKDFHEEAPLTWLVWITSIISIVVTFAASKWLLGGIDFNGTKLENLWWALSVIISCGTIAGALIPEFTKVFTSTTCGHVDEVVNASKQGGASLNILSGFVAGNFSGYWLAPLYACALVFWKPEVRGE